MFTSVQQLHCVKCPFFLAFELNTERYGVSIRIQSEYGNAGQNNFDYGHFSRIAECSYHHLYRGKDAIEVFSDPA